jgi:glutamate racemase
VSNSAELSQDAPIGVFDSGVGGLSVFQAIATELPHESLIYVADTAKAPYGDRSDAEIVELSGRMTQWLVEQGCKAVVIACNTATAAAISALRDRFDITIVGIEPGVKPAVERSASKRVGVLATSYTLGSQKFRHLIERYGAQAQITLQACPGLVETLEHPQSHAQNQHQLLTEYLVPMRMAHIDTLVLGCTHYSFLRNQISELLGPGVEVLDTPRAIALELQRQLERRSLLSRSNETFTPYRYLTTGESLSEIAAIMGALIQQDIDLEPLGSEFNGFSFEP